MAARDLEGRVALVTGSARNIGRAIARQLAADGVAVMVHARQAIEQAETVAAEIREAGGRAAASVADVSDPDGVSRLVATTITTFGRLDILVNNAAVRRETPFASLTYGEWREIVSSILDAAYLCSHAALPHLIASGAGTIINIGGLSAHTGSAHRAHVVAAKAGVVGLTRALAHDLAPHGIVVNCVVPGLIDTVRDHTADGKPPAHHGSNAPLAGRRGTPEEVAAVVRFLCGPQARYITGQTVHANGGAFLS